MFGASRPNQLHMKTSTYNRLFHYHIKQMLQSKVKGSSFILGPKTLN